jgi:hypothetical protein
MIMTELDLVTRNWTAAELRHLLPAERDRILAAAAQRANKDYSLDADLIAFDAFREEDLHGHSSSTQTR